ncbi:MarR family transcriptional regulator [Beijerinckia sp. 28-YEA-48]|uniref:MarR family winged helix-turn-helix transcriptional regulator n=1 Tax=unclassified Beijerinckia TaxID=2638183 RepID=UPI00329872DE
MNSVIADRLREIGLSVPQCDILTTLTEQEGMSQQDLARRLYVTKGNISGLVDRLVAATLVERRTIPGDRRSHAIFLTEAGRSIATEAIVVQKRFVEETFAKMAPDRLAEFEKLVIEVRDLVRAAANVREPPIGSNLPNKVRTSSSPRARMRSL